MTKKKKQKSKQISEKGVEATIYRNSSPAKESKKTSSLDSERGDLINTRFTLRIPQEMMKKVDLNIKKRAGNISRNTWILEAVQEKLS